MKPIDDILKSISEDNINRYTKRYTELGRDIKTLGWGSKDQQVYRFKQTLMCEINFKGKTVLDIGCGFGDYFSFLKSNSVGIHKYIGWDINPNLINEGKKQHQGSTLADFELKNLFVEIDSGPVADIGVSLGALNFNLTGKLDNYQYSEIFLKKAFSFVREVLIVDFLSSHRFEGYPKEGFVFYHSPEKMLEFALSLSKNVVLKHNYLPIPQKEFLLFIHKG